MEVIEIIIKCGAVAAALTAVGALVWAIVKVVRKVYLFVVGLEDKVERLIKHDESQYLAILRLTVTSEEMPISERLEAGREYVTKGGNGDVKKLYFRLLARCEHAVEENNDDTE
jgi:hypothetical protein